MLSGEHTSTRSSKYTLPKRRAEDRRETAPYPYRRQTPVRPHGTDGTRVNFLRESGGAAADNYTSNVIFFHGPAHMNVPA